ncbi:MAG: GNAT family N-acetyltransferase [Butyrivibrio sp.]|nr:GNAT family N-acetyltransferase [Butyrivibrio sp.]
MQVFITVNSDRILRITDKEGAFLTFEISKDEARILSVLVPESRRRKGIGKTLLAASEKLLLTKGINKIYADFTDHAEGVKELLADVGYTMEMSTDILAVPMGVALYSPKVKKALATGQRAVTCLSLSDLTVTRMRKVFDFLADVGADVTGYDMAHCNNRISTAVFDSEGKPISVVLCTDMERDLNVDFLISRYSKDPSYILFAMLGMIEAAKMEGGEERYNRLTMTAYNSNVIALLKSTLSDESNIETISRCMCFSKDISTGDVEMPDIEYKKDEDDYQESVWEREVFDIPFQKNVLWKSKWQRDRDNKEIRGAKGQE